MSSNEEYFKKLLKDQEIPLGLKNNLRNTRQGWESSIRRGLSETNVRLYYAGSYKKETMIRESFDLDLVIYYPYNTSLSLLDIHNEIKGILQSENSNPHERGVALRCNRSYRDYGSFHIDFVPGKAEDASFSYAWLYNQQKGRRIKTNIDLQVNAILATRRRNIIKLLKLWKAKKSIDCPTFILELFFIRYIQTLNPVPQKVDTLLLGTFRYIANHILNIRLVDPANTNNVVSNELNNNQKNQLRNHAQNAVNAQYWSDVFG